MTSTTSIAPVGLRDRSRRVTTLAGAAFPYIALALIFIVMAILLHGQGFLDPTNLLNIVLQTTPITVMAVGAVFVLSTGQIDLSIGAVVALSALVSATFLTNYGLLAGILAGLLTGAVVGLVNGFLVTFFRLPSFLVTLGMTGLIAGLSQQYTNLQAVPTLNTTFNDVFGSGTPFGIPSLIIWTLVVLAVGHYVYRHTRVGAHVLAVGDDARSARVSGIKADRILLGVMVLSGVCAAVAGLLYTGRLHGASYTLGGSDQLTVIAAAVIGGTGLFGGKGSVVGAFAGSLIFGMLRNGLILAGFTDAQQQIAQGVIILIAVILTLREKKNA
jgi:ribose transport system permease protein